MTNRATSAVLEIQRDGYTISTDPVWLDLDVIHGELSGSYWAAGRPRETVARSLQHALCFGLYHDEAQVGLARVVTDYATFAWLCDVFILEAHRGPGSPATWSGSAFWAISRPSAPRTMSPAPSPSRTSTCLR
jgi:hypothetical protein